MRRAVVSSRRRDGPGSNPPGRGTGWPTSHPLFAVKGAELHFLGEYRDRFVHLFLVAQRGAEAVQWWGEVRVVRAEFSFQLDSSAQVVERSVDVDDQELHQAADVEVSSESGSIPEALCQRDTGVNLVEAFPGCALDRREVAIHPPSGDEARRAVGRRSEEDVEPVAPLALLPTGDPVGPQGDQDLESGAVELGRALSVAQRLAEVRQISSDFIEDDSLMGAEPRRFQSPGQVQDVLEVFVVELRSGTAVVEALPAELPEGLQHLVLRAIERDDRLLDQLGQVRQHLVLGQRLEAADTFGGLEIDSPGEAGKPSPQLARLWAAEVMAPTDRGQERLVSWRNRSAPVCEHPIDTVIALEQLLRRQRAHAHRSELHGKWEAVQQAADREDLREILVGEHEPRRGCAARSQNSSTDSNDRARSRVVTSSAGGTLSGGIS